MVLLFQKNTYMYLGTCSLKLFSSGAWSLRKYEFISNTQRYLQKAFLLLNVQILETCGNLIAIASTFGHLQLVLIKMREILQTEYNNKMKILWYLYLTLNREPLVRFKPKYTKKLPQLNIMKELLQCRANFQSTFEQCINRYSEFKFLQIKDQSNP